MVGRHVVPVRLGLRNIFILPTGYGLLFLILLVAMLLGSINYNNNLGFLLTFLLGSVMLSSLMHTYSMLHGLDVLSIDASPTFAGEPAVVLVQIESNERLRKGLQWSLSGQPSIGQDVAHQEPTRVALTLPTNQRGLFRTGILRIHSEYPTGLFRVWSRLETTAEYLVYPKPLSAPLPEREKNTGRGSQKKSPLAGVDDFAGLNNYQPGDPPGRIHWPSYSRGQGLYVKIFSDLYGTTQVFDFRSIPGNDLERKLSILCFHILAADQQNLPFGLQLPGHALIPPATGRLHRNRCLRALTLFTTR